MRLGSSNECSQMGRRRRLAEPVIGLDDLQMAAEAAYWTLWSDANGLSGPDGDAELAAGPSHDLTCGDGAVEALAALFRAVRLRNGVSYWDVKAPGDWWTEVGFV